MDELDRLFARIVSNLAALDPSRVHGPIAVSDLYQQLVPYRTHRTSLAVDTHEDYEMVLLRLLAGERGYAFVEPEEARTALAAEAASINPDTGLYHHYDHATVTFDPAHVHAALGGDATEAAGTAPEPEAFAAQAARGPAPAPDWFPVMDDAAGDEPERGADPSSAGPGAGLPFALEEDESAEPAAAARRSTSAPCSFCGGALPVGRAVMFCPHCGQNVGVVHCPSCGTELDLGWRFCITCGRQMGPLA
jgi:Double zinc ribbon